MNQIDNDYAENYQKYAAYQRLDRNNRDKESCHIPLDDKIFIKDSVRTFLDDTYQLLMDRFKGYKHVYQTHIKKHGCWCLRHIQEGILALIIANNKVDFGDDEAIQIEYIVCKKTLNTFSYISHKVHK